MRLPLWAAGAEHKRRRGPRLRSRREALSSAASGGAEAAAQGLKKREPEQKMSPRRGAPSAPARRRSGEKGTVRQGFEPNAEREMRRKNEKPRLRERLRRTVFTCPAGAAARRA